MSETRNRRTLATVLALPMTLALGLGVAFAQDANDSNDPSGTSVDAPDSFTSEISLNVSGDEVVIDDPSDATGTYDLRFNSDDDIICHDIVIRGASDDAASPAPTANHIHQGDAGEAGPAIWLFPNPEMNADGDLVVEGCLEGSFNAGEDAPPPDVADIEADPSNFYVDYHSSDFEPGEVRGQLTDLQLTGDDARDDDARDDDARDDDVADDDARDDAVPAPGGVPAGGEGGPATDSSTLFGAVALGLLLLAAVGVAATGRRSEA